MPLFQQSVVKKYITDINKSELQTAWQLFTAYFQDAARQENIRNLKEEEFQEGFIRELFVKVLGYTLNPDSNFDIELEKKSVTDATKSDGAILSNNDVIAVIELKDTGTTDLDKVSNQAFGYKHKHKNCTYVITSNFEKLRFYIGDATDFEEFNLFNLTQQQFSLLYLCLQKEYLLANIPLQVKQQSLTQEENVTKKLYADYSLFKRKLFQNIAAQNTQYDKLLLFKKTQKLLDRFLFIFFAEDRLLLPPNSVREILIQWEDLKTKYDEYFPLYNRFKKYFGYLNTGYVGKQHEIFAYNGGLFAEDEVLDNIVLDDAILFEGTKTLSNYDFETDIDVNILGHIFEHSLTEIEELQAELEGTKIERKTIKRKKDGVFYTPRYITKYIVENTVGALCTQKKEELKINEENFAPKKRKDKRRQLLEVIETYRSWLLQLTICDPACGSGAFLNAALEYLKQEHREVDELKASLFNDAIVYTDIDNSILENNLFGVDINEEAIEIAKLSLWLHTARKGRKLSNLSNNIKCGNSLIDDKTIAGNKAFNWKEEFEAVFDKGGFDVVIGNPPWGAAVSAIEKNYFINKYLCKSGEVETYIHFIDMSFNSLLKNDGIISLITPNTWFYLDKYEVIRKFLIDFNILELVELEKNIFEDAPDIIPVIFTVQKNLNQSGIVKTYKLFKGKVPSYLIDKNIFTTNTIDKADWLKIKGTSFNLLLNKDVSDILTKINKHSFLSEKYNVRYGIKTGNNAKYLSKENNESDKDWKKCLASASSIKRYLINWEHDYLDFGEHLAGYSTNTFEKPKILIQYIRKLSMERRLIAAFDEDGIYYPLNNFSFIEAKSEDYELFFLLELINSKIINFYFKNCFIDYNIKPKYLEKIPIPNVTVRLQLNFKEKADIMLSKNKELQQLSQQFIQFLQAKYATININNKLESWYTLTANEFVKEFSKQKIKLTLSEQQEWLQYFEELKTKANNIQSIITQTDKEIDAMVYELYGLTSEEIKIVEGDK